MATKETATTAQKEISVEERLKALYSLQRVMSEIDKIRTLRGELPLEVQDLEDELTGLQTRVNNFKVDIENLEKENAQEKIAIHDAEQKIAKREVDQNNIRNNREYEALTKEIENLHLDIELSQTTIKNNLNSIQAKNNDVEITNAKLEERKKDLEDKKNELDEIIAETRQEENSLLEKSKDLEQFIEPRLLTAFKRIRRNARNGLAVVSVERDACGGCFNKIPPQRQLDIRQRKKIIVCEYCGRILVDKDLTDEINSQDLKA